MGIVRHLIDKKTLKILELLLKNQDKYSHLSAISSHSKIPIASTFRIVNQLVSIGIIDVMVMGKMKVYRMESNDQTRELERILTGTQKKSELKT